MRCPDCNKFVSYDDSTDPEVELEVDEEGSVTGTVRIVLTCADCSTELKDAEFEVDVDAQDFAEEHKGDGHELSVEDNGISLVSRQESVNPKTKKPIPFRYRRSYYGAAGSIDVSCSCGGNQSFEWEEEVQASGMNEI